MNLHSLSRITGAFRGFLISAVKVFTVLSAFCLAFRPALITVSESEDREALDEIEAGREHFGSVMTELVENFFIDYTS